MKITTVRSNFGKEVRIFGGKSLKFDGTGICEIKDKKLSGEIISKYPTLFFDAEAEGVKAIKKENSPLNKVNENLERKIAELESIIESKKHALGTLEKDKKEWAELAQKNEEKANVAEKQLKEEKAAFDSKVRRFELEISLMNSNVETMKNICEKSEFPKEEWERLGKKDLIEYVIKKSD